MRICYLKDGTNHIPEIASLFHSEWSRFHPGRTLEDVVSLLTARSTNTEQLDLTLLSLNKTTWTGSVSLKQYDMETVRDLTPWLSSVYVKREFRGQGIARRLIQELLRKARELGFDIVYLCTVDAENYYSALGWKRVRLATEHGMDFIIMSYQF